MDHEADFAAAIIDRRGHRIDQKWHVVVDDFDDRVWRRPAVGLRLGIVYPDLGAAGFAPGRELPQRQRGAAQIIGAARGDVAGRHMLVEQRDKAAQRSLLGAVRSGIRQGLGVADPLRLLQLDRARHRVGPNYSLCVGARESPLRSIGASGFGTRLLRPSDRRTLTRAPSRK